MRKTTEEFIQQANQVHNNKFDYSLVEYKNAKTKIKIICPVHGIFEQIPDDHLRGNGCRLCSGKGIALTQEQFIERASIIHNNQYDYSLAKYTRLDNKVTIICPIHGQFKITPRAILQSNQGCKRCGLEQARIERTKTTEQFILDAQLVHQSNYIYDTTQYINSQTKLDIICPKHGSFKQKPTNHLQGQGCPKCSKERMKIMCGGNILGKQPTPFPHKVTERQNTKVGKYNKQWFEQFPDNKLLPAQLYCIEFKYNTDHFIKIGITTQTIKQRYTRTGMGESRINKTILGTKYMSLYDAFLKEQQLLLELKQYQYFPNYVLDGYTECLKHHPDVINRIQQEFRL